MRNETTVSKWGNSLAVRIPQGIAKQARISEGDCLAMALQRDGAIVLRSTRPRYDLSELVSRITPRNRHREIDWGPPVGEESW
ncbi:MAG: AbrB/MazE/SpoVT family DNA-binding domain-containing protein [Bryobacteraceae bacterium]|jgi:antitoxin MazE